MTMTAERLAELDAVMAKMSEPRPTKIEHKYTISDWCGRIEYAKYALADAYPDMRAHIDAQAATIARQDEALREIVASDSPLGRNGVPSHKEIARRALKGIDHE